MSFMRKDKVIHPGSLLESGADPATRSRVASPVPVDPGTTGLRPAYLRLQPGVQTSRRDLVRTRAARSGGKPYEPKEDPACRCHFHRSSPVSSSAPSSTAATASLAVATGKAVQQDLIATVSGTGQIKPLTYVNVGATAFGRITHLYVKEGDHVDQGPAHRHRRERAARLPGTGPAGHHRRQSRPTSTPTSPPKRPPRPTSPKPRPTSSRSSSTTSATSSSTKSSSSPSRTSTPRRPLYDVDVATLQQRMAAVAQAKAQTALRAQPGHPVRCHSARKLLPARPHREPRPLQRPRHQRPRPRRRDRRRRHPERRGINPDDPR